MATTTETTTTGRDEKVAQTQALDEARERVQAEADAEATGTADQPAEERDEAEIVEEQDGQTALATNDPITLSTDVDGPRPTRAEVKVKAFKEDIGHDLQPGDRRLYIVETVVTTIDGLGSNLRTHNAEAIRYILMEDPGVGGDMTAGDAIQALYDLQSREQYDRAVIDQAAKVAELLFDNEDPENGQHLAFLMREKLFERFHIDDDAHEATYGTDDEDEESATAESEPEALTASGTVS